MFETLAVRDLRVVAQLLDGEVFHYLDKSGLQIDAIVQLPDSRSGAFEVKLGAARIDERAASLSKFASKVDNELIGEPGVLGVITPGGYGYVRPDEVAVIPITALGP